MANGPGRGGGLPHDYKRRQQRPCSRWGAESLGNNPNRWADRYAQHVMTGVASAASFCQGGLSADESLSVSKFASAECRHLRRSRGVKSLEPKDRHLPQASPERLTPQVEVPWPCLSESRQLRHEIWISLTLLSQMPLS